MIPAKFDELCPNCGGEIESERLEKGLVCRNCLPEDKEMSLKEMIELLIKRGKLLRLRKVAQSINEYEEFEKLFSQILSSKPNGIQRGWGMRFFNGENFALTSPPGSGKTTFGIALSLFLLKKGIKTLFVVPTKTLAVQIKDRIKTHSNILNKDIKIFDSNTREMPIESSDIAVITSKYLFAHFDEVSKFDFGLLFVDDVDAAFKSNKSVRLILKLSGYTDEDLDLARNLIKSKEVEKLELIRDKIKRRILLSSGTIRKANPMLVFLLGFKPGNATFFERNVADLFYKPKLSLDEEAKNLVKKLGSGGLIFVAEGLGSKVEELLKAEGIKAERISGKNAKLIEEFAKGKLDVLVGSASHYGLLVRGIDLPERVRYALFIGVPRFVFGINEKPSPILLLRILQAYARFSKDEEIARIAGALRKKLAMMSIAAIQMIYREALEDKLTDNLFIEAYKKEKEIMENKEFVEQLPNLLGAVIKEGRMFIPDITTYLQASSRTSRFRAWGNTFGVSVIIIDDEKLFDLLSESAYLSASIKFSDIEKTNYEELMRKVDADRERVRNESKDKSIKETEAYSSVLIIVESPHKAKTIASFFSKPTVIVRGPLVTFETLYKGKNLIIAYTAGHVTELTLDKVGYHGVELGEKFVPHYSAIKECENGHKVATSSEYCPTCGGKIKNSKLEMIETLRKMALEVDKVLLGSDPDSEGEKIAWDLSMLLRPYNKNIERIEFHEVTKGAIINALENPRQIDENMVKAQMVRRIDDRWIGFELSYRVQTDFWKEYTKSDAVNRNLSAGRVQTPVLGWIIERYNRYKDRSSTVYAYTISLPNKYNVMFISKSKIKQKEIEIAIENVKIEEESVNPLPPYILSDALKDISNKLGISAQDGMKLLQDLFEAGLITYPRTDSTRVSNTGIELAKYYIVSELNLGEEYFQARKWGEGGAHEALRPTKPLDREKLKEYIETGLVYSPIPITYRHYQVYDLIFKRFISSQMAPAKVTFENMEIEINGEKITEKLPIKVEFEGFFRITPLYKTTYSELNEGKITVELPTPYKYKAVELYSEGDLVEEMKNRGIGRPSTYATIVSTILNRRYATLSKIKKKIVPTKLGINVYAYLSSHFDYLVREDLTAKLESMMDKVENGEEDYTMLLRQILEEIKSVLKVEI